MEIKFFERKKELRKETGLKQSELGDKLGVTQRKISYWEMGKIEPSFSDLWRISDFFGVTVDYLIGKREY